MEDKNMLDIKVGEKVKTKSGKVGIIVSVGKYINVEFGDKTSDFQLDAFEKGYLIYLNEELQKLVNEEIARIEKERAIEEEKKRIAAEEARKRNAELAAQRAAEEAAKKAAADERAKNRNKGKKSGPIHPYIDARRRAGKPVIFMVCQNANYDVESRDGYIWAPDHKMRGDTDFASHAEMDQVKEGDIIIHHFGNRIYAISIAKKDCERKAATLGHPNYGEVGRYAELSYHFLDNPADTSGLKNEKVTYGSMKYGPFEKTGKNKEGFYLSELADELALAFVEAAITANPSDSGLFDFKKKI